MGGPYPMKNPREYLYMVVLVDPIYIEELQKLSKRQLGKALEFAIEMHWIQKPKKKKATP
jgi:hypothetical protein